jgi:hypothetical protein
LLSSTFARMPVLAVLLMLGILVSFGALLLRLHDIVFGDPKGPTGARQGVLRSALPPSRPGVPDGHLAAGSASALVPFRRDAARVVRLDADHAFIAHARRQPSAVAAL